MFVASQSTTLIDYFEAEDLVVVDRTQRASKFKRLDPDKIQD